MRVAAHPITERFGTDSAGQTLLSIKQCLSSPNSHSCTAQFCPHKDPTYHFRGRSVGYAYSGPPLVCIRDHPFSLHSCQLQGL
jgi:hypothetical protein